MPDLFSTFKLHNSLCIEYKNRIWRYGYLSYHKIFYL